MATGGGGGIKLFLYLLSLPAGAVSEAEVVRLRAILRRTNSKFRTGPNIKITLTSQLEKVVSLVAVVLIITDKHETDYLEHIYC